MAQRPQAAALTQRWADDVLNTARPKLTVWGAAAGAGQKGWKASPSSALLECMWSHTPCSKCQTQQAAAAQLSSAPCEISIPPPELRLALQLSMWKGSQELHILIISLLSLLWEPPENQMLCPTPGVTHSTLHIDHREKAEILRQIRPLWMPQSTHIFRGELAWNWQVWGLNASEDQKCQTWNLEDKELSPSDWKSVVKVTRSVLAGNLGQTFWTALNMRLFWVLSTTSLVLRPPSNTSPVSRNRFIHSTAQTYSQGKKQSVL